MASKRCWAVRTNEARMAMCLFLVMDRAPDQCHCRVLEAREMGLSKACQTHAAFLHFLP